MLRVTIAVMHRSSLPPWPTWFSKRRQRRRRPLPSHLHEIKGETRQVVLFLYSASLWPSLTRRTPRQVWAEANGALSSGKVPRGASRPSRSALRASCSPSSG